MAYRDLSETQKQRIRYGAIAAVCLVVAGGGAFYFLHGSSTPKTQHPIATGGAAPGSPSTGQSQESSASPDEQPVPTDQQMAESARLIGEARRLANDGRFAEAEADLQKADKIIPNQTTVQDARADIEKLKTPQGQLLLRLGQARLAIDHNDGPAAQKAIDEAAKLNPDAPELASLREDLGKVVKAKDNRDNRITQLLTEMREAIARKDYGAADTALNQAERIDIGNPLVHQARIELNRAQNPDSQSDKATPAPRLSP